MKRNVAGFVSLFLAVTMVSCSSPSPSPTGAAPESGDAAVVGGEVITMAELDEAAKSQLQKVATQVYQIKKRVLNDMLEEKLIAQAAKAKGMKVGDFLASEIEAKLTPPTEAEMKAFYEARKEDGKQTFEEVKDRVRAHLEQTKRSVARRDMISRLRQASEVKIHLSPPRMNIDTADLPVFGNKGAEISIVEFSDYQCPFCKRVRPTIWKLMEDYKGKVKYVFVDFPLSFHRQAKKAHEAARCAGDQGKYYDYNQKVFDNQNSLEIPALKKYAKDLKLDSKKFDQCLDGGKYASLVDEGIRKGVDAGVTGTPAFFINGIMLSGAQPAQSFIEVIEGELNR
ncbi:MAG: Disulfide bond formation protein D precursor [bacterium ADurb.Bin270]|nr:thioredoxin domain-containing protein [Myxococcales bacterium]OQA61223.1 MAG: Disulfide bond formation protein D precursor [bacterium ADurb.Bin270]HQC50635.1 thioredoxin domain-containing protein [bacterium]HQG13221.1 thioredoxin domain-containing protein [bacterium]HQH80737.1 thioredoxin domain-containing protein [bacterium]